MPRVPLSFFTIAFTLTSSPRLAPAANKDVNDLVRPYSTQQIIHLNLNEATTFTLNNGQKRSIRLLSVTEHRDSVIKLVRRADVRLAIDDKPFDLLCAPYVMPTQAAGLRLLVDSTSGWGNIPKTAQLSLWDPSDPIVDIKKFTFPIRNFRLFSQGTQTYNEPVHLGLGDGDPTGQQFYHDYGFDNAGFEGREEVLSAVQGTIVKFAPSRENICSVLVQDANGSIWEYAHLQSIDPQLTLNMTLSSGHKIGLLGKTGPSGNFSHLHLGAFLSRSDADSGHAARQLNLYPWLVTAYRAKHPSELLAVARPHQLALTRQTVSLDASNSLAFASRIVDWRWVLPDGTTLKQPKVQTTFDRPGAYVAALWVKDNLGQQDVDFCQIKVFSRDNPEKAIPHIFMTQTPTQNIQCNQTVTFRFWFQGQKPSPIRVDFSDGTQVANYQSYSELPHAFTSPGIHIVTARCQLQAMPITQTLKVIVHPPK